MKELNCLKRYLTGIHPISDHLIPAYQLSLIIQTLGARLLKNIYLRPTRTFFYLS